MAAIGPNVPDILRPDNSGPCLCPCARTEGNVNPVTPANILRSFFSGTWLLPLSTSTPRQRSNSTAAAATAAAAQQQHKSTALEDNDTATQRPRPKNVLTHKICGIDDGTMTPLTHPPRHSQRTGVFKRHAFRVLVCVKVSPTGLSGRNIDRLPGPRQALQSPPLKGGIFGT